MANSFTVNKILDDIIKLYESRKGTQEEIATMINCKYNVSLNHNHIHEVTDSAGFVHTIKRKNYIQVVQCLSESFRKAIGEIK